TNLTLDLLDRARQQFLAEPEVGGHQPVVLAEMTLRNLMTASDESHSDFLARADLLGALNYDVLISRFETYYQLAEYLARYTDGLVGLAVGLPSIRQIADEKYYTDLPGGVLESAGRLFKRSVKMYVYPTRDSATGAIQTLEDLRIPPPWNHLHQLLREIGRIVPIRSFNESFLSIRPTEVLAQIESGDSTWETMVPSAVAQIIKSKNLFQKHQAHEAISS
ncbi:MAG TPA: hypothetical protein VKK61_05575, partial [Tepidisphaeraceae bacterium]|nr:hypothetical protein [Tepidisphaeraceae bacterium]